MVTCYMVVSPNPRTTPSEHYYVKFGDGANEASYKRCNPDFVYKENALAPQSTLNVVTYSTVEEAKRPGKWLEWIHIKITGGAQVYAGTEWHKLQLKPFKSSDELRRRLCTLLDLFPRWNRWTENGGDDDVTRDFTNLMDSTWWCDGGDEIIAQFVP